MICLVFPKNYYSHNIKISICSDWVNTLYILSFNIYNNNFKKKIKNDNFKKKSHFFIIIAASDEQRRGYVLLKLYTF